MHSANENVKSGIPNKAGASMEPKNDLVSSNTLESSEVEHCDEKEEKMKVGTFSKMLTHLTKARPKANRTKRNDAQSDYIDQSKEYAYIFQR